MGGRTNRVIVRPLAIILVLGSVLGLGLLSLHGRSRPAQAQQLAPVCSNASLNGTYGFWFTGSVVAGPDGAALPNAVPATVVGLITYDGSGGITYAFTQNVGGRSASNTWTGTYSVNADCTGADALTTPQGVTRRHALVVVGGGNRVHFAAMDADLVGSGEAERLKTSE